MNDEKYMARALELARNGLGWTSPNPMVGAVIVKAGRIIGEGWHRRCGELHAEREALASCSENPAGSTVYVTLEPCCHQGRQPPCTQALLEAGVSRVVIGAGDPNPLVAGKGIRLLRRQGITVDEHVMEQECMDLNQVFFHFIRTGTPFTVMKYAMTLDGKIAAYTGASKWITGETARNHVHRQRHRYSAIMAGVGTVLADDPLLTCRMEGGKNPVRVICDSRLRTPLTSQIVKTAGDVPTILATCSTDMQAARPYQDAGCAVLTLPCRDGHVDLQALMAELGERQIDSVLLEGGGTLNWAALKAGIVHKILAYISPRLLGGKEAKSPIGGEGFPSPNEAIKLTDGVVTQLGEDILFEYDVFFTERRRDNQPCSQES